MTTDLSKELRFEATVPVIVTSQARKVLSTTSYSEQDFLDWAVKQITFGGGNVISFLEYMANSDDS